MSNPAPSSHSGRESQPVNPYAASREATPLRPNDSRSQLSAESERQFQARMTWFDRRDFLLSVGAARVSAVCGALVWLKSCYEVIRLWYAYLFYDSMTMWTQLALLGFAALVLVQGLVALYACFVEWKYAEELRLIAGGSTATMEKWSRLHLLSFRLFAVTACLGLAAECGKWLFTQVASRWIFPA